MLDFPQMASSDGGFDPSFTPGFGPGSGPAFSLLHRPQLSLAAPRGRPEPLEAEAGDWTDPRIAVSH